MAFCLGLSAIQASIVMVLVVEEGCPDVAQKDLLACQEQRLANELVASHDYELLNTTRYCSCCK